MDKTELKRKLLSSTKKRIVTLLIVLIVIFFISMLMTPIVIISQATGRVEYQGSDAEHPLQDIFTAEEFGLEANELTLQTKDGLNLWASEIVVSEPKGIIIYLTGIQQPSVTYFYGHSSWMKDNGYASILLEVRGHGNSEGDKVSLGYKEVKDVEAVIEYIKGQRRYKSVPIIIHGVSMGGAIAINSFGSLNDIDGLIAMSAYSSFEDVVYDTMRHYKIPKFICEIQKIVISSYLQVIFGSDARNMVPIKKIENTGTRKALLIACSGDTEVLPVNMHRLLEVAPKSVDSWLRDSWEHFIVKDSDFRNVEKDTEYLDRILSFIEEVSK